MQTNTVDKKLITLDKPDLPRRLFWEYQYDNINWKRSFRKVIERTLDWGKDAEVDEVIRFYGKAKVKRVLMKHSIYLMEHSLDRACSLFKVKKEDTFCYQ